MPADTMTDTSTTGTLFGTELSGDPVSVTEGAPSSWFGPYITDYLNKQAGLSRMGFTPFSGELTAGTSDLQTKAFQGIGNLTLPSTLTGAGERAANLGTYDPTQFGTNRFNTAYAQQYMNPYLEAALQPQLQEAQRQAEQKRLADAGRLTQAGAFGGSRQAIMESEGNRNLMQNLANITGTGYATAYDKAMGQFNADEQRLLEAQRMGEQSRQFGAGQDLAGIKTMADIGGQEAQYGLQNLQQQLAAGKEQRDIEQQGLTADYGQYLREFNYPQEQLDKYGAALKTVPAYATYAQNIYGQVPGAAGSAVQGLGDLMGLLQLLGVFGSGSGTATP